MVPEAENRDQIWSEMVQKRSKNEPKTATNHIGAREMTQDSGRWPKTAGDDPKQGYHGKLEVQNGGQNWAKIVTKTIRKLCFLIGHWIRRWREKGYQNQPKWRPRWSKIDPRRERKEKTRKVWKRTTVLRFGSILGVRGGGKSKRKSKKGCRKHVGIQVWFRSRFFKDFLRFWSHLGTQNGPKIEKKGVKKQSDF